MRRLSNTLSLAVRRSALKFNVPPVAAKSRPDNALPEDRTSVSDNVLMPLLMLSETPFPARLSEKSLLVKMPLNVALCEAGAAGLLPISRLSPPLRFAVMLEPTTDIGRWLPVNRLRPIPTLSLACRRLIVAVTGPVVCSMLVPATVLPPLVETSSNTAFNAP